MSPETDTQIGDEICEVLLFHHALGLTPGCVAFADRLRATGHIVHTPDLYDGRTFAELDAGVAHAERIGFETIIERGAQAADQTPAATLYVGVSLGVLPAQMLAQTRADATGAVLISAAVPTSEFGERWPTGLPVQIHMMNDDPVVIEGGDLDAARELAASADAAELFLYPGDGHLFVDDSLRSYDDSAAAAVVERIARLLSRSQST